MKLEIIVRIICQGLITEALPNIHNTTARPIVLLLDISLDSGHLSLDLSLDLSRKLLRNRSP